MLHSAVARELLPGLFAVDGRSTCCQFKSSTVGSYQDPAHSGINVQKEPTMTVGDLRKKLEGIDLETKVVVQWEIDIESTYFDVANVSLRKGTLSRFEGIAGFKFGGDGSPWLFIEVAEA
jgi:hypothetical protein